MQALRAFGVAEADIERVAGAGYFQAPPELYPDNEEYLAAFAALSPLRPVGFSAGAIPAAEMLAYCEIHGVADTEEFFGRVRAADQAWLDWTRSKKRDG